MSDSKELAQKIMALVDEFPSEPFSFERREVEDKIYLAICSHTQESEGELDESYNLGVDQGYDDGYAEATDEAETRIQELEDELEDLREELEDTKERIEQAFAEGYQAANPSDDEIIKLN